jgi:hypothetical protein
MKVFCLAAGSEYFYTILFIFGGFFCRTILLLEDFCQAAGSEYFYTVYVVLFCRTILLLEDFCQAAGSEYFYTCLWECVKSCPSVRLPAITYLLYHYNKKQTMEDQLFMMGLNIDLMVRIE